MILRCNFPGVPGFPSLHTDIDGAGLGGEYPGDPRSLGPRLSAPGPEPPEPGSSLLGVIGGEAGPAWAPVLGSSTAGNPARIGSGAAIGGTAGASAAEPADSSAAAI